METPVSPNGLGIAELPGAESQSASADAWPDDVRAVPIYLWLDSGGVVCSPISLKPGPWLQFLTRHYENYVERKQPHLLLKTPAWLIDTETTPLSLSPRTDPWGMHTVIFPVPEEQLGLTQVW